MFTGEKVADCFLHALLHLMRERFDHALAD